MAQETRISREAQKAILDFFSSSTGLPIGLCEFDRGSAEMIFSDAAKDHLESYCKAIQDLTNGPEMCRKDEMRRASETEVEGLKLCHAGLYNYILPIRIDDTKVATMLCGEMRIAGDRYEKSSLEKHREFARRMNLSAKKEAELHRLFDQTKVLTEDEVQARVSETLHRAQEWYHGFLSNRQSIEKRIQKVTHELQIRLQAAFAYASNLSDDLREIRNLRKDLKELAKDVLYSLEGLDVVVQNLGPFLQDYLFERKTIGPIIYRSRDIYRAEAERRGVSIRVNLELIDGKSPVLEVSVVHLQRAMHNLVHNAVKYSFYGAYRRPRSVDIRGRCAGEYYRIDIENFGVGIDKDEYDKIFVEGYQGRHTVDEYRTGAGMGLAFVKEAIERHHGKIEVHSIDQQSAHLNIFSIYLPYEQPKEKGSNERGKENSMD